MKRFLVTLCLLVAFTSQALAANIYITEFAALGSANSGTPQIAALPPVAHQKVDFSGGVTSAAALNAATKFIRVMCDAACSIRVGGTATISYMRLPTDGIEYFGVPPGGAVISVIANP